MYKVIVYRRGKQRCYAFSFPSFELAHLFIKKQLDDKDVLYCHLNVTFKNLI